MANTSAETETSKLAPAGRISTYTSDATASVINATSAVTSRRSRASKCARNSARTAKPSGTRAVRNTRSTYEGSFGPIVRVSAAARKATRVSAVRPSAAATARRAGQSWPANQIVTAPTA